MKCQKGVAKELAVDNELGRLVLAAVHEELKVVVIGVGDIEGDRLAELDAVNRHLEGVNHVGVTARVIGDDGLERGAPCVAVGRLHEASVQLGGRRRLDNPEGRHAVHSTSSRLFVRNST